MYGWQQDELPKMRAINWRLINTVKYRHLTDDAKCGIEAGSRIAIENAAFQNLSTLLKEFECFVRNKVKCAEPRYNITPSL